MAKDSLKTKELAQRIDPVYYRTWHRLRRCRFLLSVAAFLGAALWIALAYAQSDRSVYANGPVSSSHKLIENDCARCHAEGFGPVYDASCYICHAVGSHVKPNRGRDPACATCHAEHRGRARLVHVPDGHCNACHADHANITSFANHAKFRPKPRDQHLSFSHKVHLAADLVGGPLDCGSCHWDQPEARDFRPIRFEDHCARCHTERLEPEAGAKVPHGIQPDRLANWIAAIYVNRLRDEATPPSSVPGRGATERPAWADAVRTRTDAAVAALLRPGRGCLLCHVTEKSGIRPPEIPSNWLPKARFSHRSHRGEECASCHDVAASESAADLSLPPRHDCAECHREGGAKATCQTCHTYHPTAHTGAWR